MSQLEWPFMIPCSIFQPRLQLFAWGRLQAWELSCSAQERRGPPLLTAPTGRILIHQPLGGAQGQATDIGIQAKEILRLKKTLNMIMAENTGKKLEDIEKDTDRDYFMSAEEALEYGLIDKVIESRGKT